MKRNFLLLMSGVLGIGLLLYFLSPVSKPDAPAPEVVLETEPLPPEPEPQPEPEPRTPPPPPPEPEPEPPEVEEPEGPTPEVRRNFAQHLRELGRCLEVQNDVPGDELDPTVESLVDSVRGEWGEAVISTEDWREIEIETPEKERRRIRVEMDFDTDSQVQRRLQYLRIGEDGTTTLIALPEDQTIEPSESLIASLEADNKVTKRQRFERIYFQNGEEIVAHQVNGSIRDLELNRGPKTFKCTQLNEESGTCECL